MPVLIPYIISLASIFSSTRDLHFLILAIDSLHKMSQALMDYETLDVDQIDDIMAGGEPRAPKSTEEPPSKGSKESSVGDAAEQKLEDYFN